MAIVVQFKRNIKQGFINFWRNGWVSLATVLVMVLTLFVFGSLFFSNVLLTSALKNLEDKVDISVYFKSTAVEDDILAMKSSVEKLPEVKSVEYVTRDQALENFKERHKENALITQSLEELGNNPLGASLNITAKDPNQYESIAKFLDSQNNQNIVDEINYRKNQVVIDGMNSMIKSSRASGLTSTIVLAIIATLVAFNTIRLAIYTSRDEISVMRLVGATNNYIRGPFIVEGVIHGILATIMAVVIFWIILWLGHEQLLFLFIPLSPVFNVSGVSASQFFGGPDLFVYFLSNIIWIFLMLLVVGIVLGVISSLIATRRYLREK